MQSNGVMGVVRPCPACALRPHRTLSGLLLALLLSAACGESTTAPAEPLITLTAVGDALIHAAPTMRLPEPLRVLAADAATGAPLPEVEVTWQVTGSATLARGSSVTDEYGVASIVVTSGNEGTSQVLATVERQEGAPASFELRTIPRPTIQSVSPAIVQPGSEIVITGTGFSHTPHENTVLFDGLRGAVTAATTTELRVRMPPCLPARTIGLRAGIDFALSDTHALTSTGSDAGTLTLAPGEAHTIADPDALTCIRLEYEPDAQYLIVSHNVSSAFGPPAWLDLHALGTDAIVAAVESAPLLSSFAADWEAGLRARERVLPAPRTRDIREYTGADAVPEVGDRREFNVLNAEQKFDRIDAVARVVSDRAVLYVDVAAASAFSEADLRRFAALFDDPIYARIAAVYGEPSDIDGNDRVLIVFTPRVNALTPRSANSFVAGFFYGCDLVSESRCSGTNGAEVFYSVVPDGTGQWSDIRSLATVMASVPPVLAHELQHMINFAQRGLTSDELWLSEALAHVAEELIGEVFEARNDPVEAGTFYQGNRARARQYLHEPDAFSLIAQEPPGTLGMRGGGWLFLEYLRGHHGGDDLLRRLTTGTRSGVANVTAETGRGWEELLTGFALALWVDDAPEVDAHVAPQYTFDGFSPRDALYTRTAPIYPLQPPGRPWTGFSDRLVLPPSSQAYHLVRAPTATPLGPLNLALVGRDGAAVAPGSGARLSVFRIR